MRHLARVVLGHFWRAKSGHFSQVPKPMVANSPLEMALPETGRLLAAAVLGLDNWPETGFEETTGIHLMQPGREGTQPGFGPRQLSELCTLSPVNRPEPAYVR